MDLEPHSIRRNEEHLGDSGTAVPFLSVQTAVLLVSVVFLPSHINHPLPEQRFHTTLRFLFCKIFPVLKAGAKG